jgi:hypothetical protein
MSVIDHPTTLRAKLALITKNTNIEQNARDSVVFLISAFARDSVPFLISR